MFDMWQHVFLHIFLQHLFWTSGLIQKSVENAAFNISNDDATSRMVDVTYDPHTLWQQITQIKNE